MLGLSAIDVGTLLFYFVVVTVAGLWTARSIKDTSDFFMGGRRFGKIFMIFFAFGAGTSGNDAVGVASKTYTAGFSGIWWQWLWLFCTPFYWLIAPVMRRMRCLTTGDYFEHRYDGSVAGLYALTGVLQLTFNIGVILLGAGSMVEAITSGALDRNVAILAMTALFVIYGMAGGLAAAIVTDFLQGILTVILSFMLVPFALNAVGGFTGLHEKIGDKEMFHIVAPGEINGFYILMLCASALIGIVTQPHIMGVCAAGESEMNGRVGFATGNLLKRFCTVAWMVVGMCAIVLYPGLEGSDPEMMKARDMVFGNVARDLLPAVMPGLLGLFLAALLASVMSSCDAFMVSCSGLFTQNFYRRWIATDKDENHYVWVGRFAALAVVLGGLMFAFSVSSVPKGLLLFFKLQAIMGPAFWLGLFWRRTTGIGAWAATLVCIALILCFNLLPGFHTWAAANLPESMIWDGKFRESWQIFCILGGGFVTGIVVSLLTPRVSDTKLERVFTCIRTPVMPGEPHSTGAFLLPEGVAPAQPRKIINHPDFEIYWPSKVSLVGFGVLWGWVFALIGFVYWMATWGA
ncbi:MAG: Sodium/pantothenate symporter [Candidatus Hydrogenedentota bacterium]